MVQSVTVGPQSNLYLALVHYPVLNRRGEVIASALVNLDLHDLARLACTYGIPACYIVNPLEDQQELAERILGHWLRGVGKDLHPDRETALHRLRVVDTIEAARADIGVRHGRRPRVWATSAKPGPRPLSHEEARTRLQNGSQPALILLGTGWGLAPSALEASDAVLEPIAAARAYNHLSVRCAAAILVDRLLREQP